MAQIKVKCGLQDDAVTALEDAIQAAGAADDLVLSRELALALHRIQVIRRSSKTVF